MITCVKGDLFESPAKVLVNTVNTVGVMGKGIAKTFKEIYPEMFRQYQRLCESKRLEIGKLWLYRTSHKWILNFPTKEHWRNPSQLGFIEAGMRKFVESYAEMGITSVAFPQLGCGNGELNWDKQVFPLMKSTLEDLPINVFIYEYTKGIGVPEHRNVDAMKEWLQSEPRSLPFTEVWVDLHRVAAGKRIPMGDGVRACSINLTPNPEDGLFIHTDHPGLWGDIRGALARAMLAKLGIRMSESDLMIPSDAILALWQTVRDYGFCVPRIMPQGFEAIASCMVAIFSLLPYMKPIALSFPDSSGITRQEQGLMLVAPQGKVQLEFADSIALVQGV